LKISGERNDLSKLRKMDEKNEQDELLQKAQKVCSGREYCISDIMSLLGRWGAKDEKTKSAVINKLILEKFIDEVRYCRAFARDHFTYSQWGRVKITQALKSKNIPAEAIAAGLEAIDEGEYLALLKKIIEDQQKRIKAKNRYEFKGKILRHALGKGFESHLVYDAINSVFSDRSSE
jgi:regulatory protein